MKKGNPVYLYESEMPTREGGKEKFIFTSSFMRSVNNAGNVDTLRKSRSSDVVWLSQEYSY